MLSKIANLRKEVVFEGKEGSISQVSLWRVIPEGRSSNGRVAL